MDPVSIESFVFLHRDEINKPSPSQFTRDTEKTYADAPILIKMTMITVAVWGIILSFPILFGIGRAVMDDDILDIGLHMGVILLALIVWVYFGV